MSVVSNIKCNTCHKNKQVWHGGGDPPPKTCEECVQAKEAKEKQKALSEVAGLPLLERIKRLEEFMYDHQRKYHAPEGLRF
jgi:hypothetical protein